MAKACQILRLQAGGREDGGCDSGGAQRSRVLPVRQDKNLRPKLLAGCQRPYSYTVVRSADRGKLLLTTATIGTWFRANHPDAGRSTIDFLVLRETSAINLRLLLREYYSEPFSILLTSPEAVVEGLGGAGWCRLASVSGTVALTQAQGFAGLPLSQIQRYLAQIYFY